MTFQTLNSQADGHLRKTVETMTPGSILVVLMRGNLSVQKLLEDLIATISASSRRQLIVLLGPTPPRRFLWKMAVRRAAWVTCNTGSRELGSMPVISPCDPLGLSLFIESKRETQDSTDEVIVGDFLDNVLIALDSLEQFFLFYSQLASRIREDGRRAIFLVKEEIHDTRRLEIVKRFADRILDCEGIEVDGTITHRMKAVYFETMEASEWVLIPAPVPVINPPASLLAAPIINNAGSV